MASGPALIITKVFLVILIGFDASSTTLSCCKNNFLIFYLFLLRKKVQYVFAKRRVAFEQNRQNMWPATVGHKLLKTLDFFGNFFGVFFSFQNSSQQAR